MQNGSMAGYARAVVMALLVAYTAAFSPALSGTLTSSGTSGPRARLLRPSHTPLMVLSVPAPQPTPLAAVSRVSELLCDRFVADEEGVLARYGSHPMPRTQQASLPTQRAPHIGVEAELDRVATAVRRSLLIVSICVAATGALLLSSLHLLASNVNFPIADTLAGAMDAGDASRLHVGAMGLALQTLCLVGCALSTRLQSQARHACVSLILIAMENVGGWFPEGGQRQHSQVSSVRALKDHAKAALVRAKFSEQRRAAAKFATVQVYARESVCVCVCVYARESVCMCMCVCA